MWCCIYRQLEYSWITSCKKQRSPLAATLPRQRQGGSYYSSRQTFSFTFLAYFMRDVRRASTSHTGLWLVATIPNPAWVAHSFIVVYNWWLLAGRLGQLMCTVCKRKVHWTIAFSVALVTPTVTFLQTFCSVGSNRPAIYLVTNCTHRDQFICFFISFGFHLLI